MHTDVRKTHRRHRAAQIHRAITFAPLDIGDSSYSIESMNQTFNTLLKEIRNAIKTHSIIKYAKQVQTQRDHPLNRYLNTYPELPRFEIAVTDIAQIEELNNFPDHLLPSERQWTPLEKFFYAVLWKDGKLKSIKLIIKGIEAALNGKDAPPSKFVYYYFGRHLTNRLEEPLVDKHTMHACHLILRTKKGREFTVADAGKYRRLFLAIRKDENLRNLEDGRLVDSLFYAFGKFAKNAG
jgi:hypothetical protein